MKDAALPGGIRQDQAGSGVVCDVGTSGIPLWESSQSPRVIVSCPRWLGQVSGHPPRGVPY
jgi:hypothetical protein